MIRISIMLSMLLIYSHAPGQTSSTAEVKLADGAALLFKNVKTKISNSEKNSIYKKLDLTVTSNKKGFIAGEFPVEVFAYPTDMNKDGKEEIFVSLRSGALYGNTGENFVLFIKDNSGAYKAEGELGGGIPLILPSGKTGYPNIVIGGPGFQFPVYKWNGKKYVMDKSIDDSALGNSNAQDIETFSKAYTNQK